MSDRLLSGHEPLDAVLGGGLPANAISLITGRPGSGKTILAQQYAFRNGRPERPAVYLSTVSEPLQKIVRFGQSLSFFDGAAIGKSVFYEDLGAIKFRKFLHELAGRLGAFPAAALWVGEYEDTEIASMAEFAVADAIVDLTSERIGQREARLSSGIPALDAMLAEGYWPGASTLIAGPSGSGKTLIDQWVYELLETIDRIGARRVLIDSLADLRISAGDDIRFREFVYPLVQRFSRQNVSVAPAAMIPWSASS